MSGHTVESTRDGNDIWKLCLQVILYFHAIIVGELSFLDNTFLLVQTRRHALPLIQLEFLWTTRVIASRSAAVNASRQSFAFHPARSSQIVPDSTNRGPKA